MHALEQMLVCVKNVGMCCAWQLYMWVPATRMEARPKWCLVLVSRIPWNVRRPPPPFERHPPPPLRDTFVRQPLVEFFSGVLEGRRLVRGVRVQV